MKYTINPGFTFVEPDNTVKGGGDTIELSEDVAAANAEKVTLLVDAPAAPATRASGKRDTPADPA